MPTLQVRDLPQQTYEQLVRSARRNHRSIAQQTTAILEEHLRVRESKPTQANCSRELDSPPSVQPNVGERADQRFIRLAATLGLDPNTFAPMSYDQANQARYEHLASTHEETLS